jgi:predicted metal-dependent HD superfamily phosphohydrolase
MAIEKLKKRWLLLLQDRADEAIIEKLFEDISRKYSESHRHYHTLEHISACLKHFDNVGNDINHIFQVELAIWLHDVIYDPRKKNNEHLSAQYSSSMCSTLGIGKEMREEIARYIMLTKHPSSPETLDEKYLTDIDLSIFGSDHGTYQKYEALIRNEYSYVPFISYKVRRNKIMRQFLQKETLYQTQYFIKKFESKAKENLRWAIENFSLSK